jgi:hypothetical protein
LRGLAVQGAVAVAVRTRDRPHPAGTGSQNAAQQKPPNLPENRLVSQLPAAISALILLHAVLAGTLEAQSMPVSKANVLPDNPTVNFR